VWEKPVASAVNNPNFGVTGFLLDTRSKSIWLAVTLRPAPAARLVKGTEVVVKGKGAAWEKAKACGGLLPAFASSIMLTVHYA